VIAKSGAIESIKRRSDNQSHVISVLTGFGGPQKATAQLASLGVVFDGYPKPVDLLEYLIQFVDGSDGIFMDFFAGSGSLGHAVLNRNSVDGARRRFLLVQLPEVLRRDHASQNAAATLCETLGLPQNIAEVTKERIRRAAANVRKKGPLFSGDLGFKSFRLDTSNITPWNPRPDDLVGTLWDHLEHIQPGRSDDDVLHEVLLKYGHDLCAPIARRSCGGKVVQRIGGTGLMACLDAHIARDDVEALAMGIVQWLHDEPAGRDVSCLFLDSAFEDDVAKSNLAAILEQHGVREMKSL
jgi:adenine-specific DNA-methyltransferase